MQRFVISVLCLCRLKQKRSAELRAGMDLSLDMTFLQSGARSLWDTIYLSSNGAVLIPVVIPALLKDHTFAPVKNFSRFLIDSCHGVGGKDHINRQPTSLG